MTFYMDTCNKKRVLDVCNCPEDILQDVASNLEPYIRIRPKYLTRDIYGTIICKEGNDNAVYKRDNVIEVIWSNSVQLRMTVRRVIRAFFYEALIIRDGWVPIHASAVINAQNDVTIFTGDKGAGKTSSVLACVMKNKELKFISNDRIFINKHSSYMIGCPTTVGIGNDTMSLLNIDKAGERQNNKTWIFPNDLRDMGVKFAKGGKIKQIIVPAFDFDSKELKIFTDGIESDKILVENIRTDIQDDVWHWENPIRNREDFGYWISKTNWCKQLICIKIICGGLSEEYYKVLKSYCVNE